MAEHSTTAPPDDTTTPPIPGNTGLRVVFMVVLLFVAAVGARTVLTTEDTPEETAAAAMVEVAPGGVVAAEDIPADILGYYEAADEHFDTFSEIPCFCGCEEMLDHRHLGDCFLRADGDGLEAHALGCGVCLGEARQVTEMLEEGTTETATIKEAVVAEWGDPYLNP